MPAGDLEAALRAVECQAAAMQAIERRIAEAAKKRRAAVPMATSRRPSEGEGHEAYLARASS
jgi:hypothetical protein